MEKINIAELLKNCPQGMELDSPMYDNVIFNRITNMINYPINILVDKMSYSLTKYGEWECNNENAKCIIFPKGKTTWEGFTPPCNFKDGDVVFYDSTISIFKVWRYETLFRTYCILYTKINNPVYRFEINKPLLGKDICKKARHATEEEKQKLFQAIKANGYKWNDENKTLEKLIEPKFKVGDKVRKKGDSKYHIIEDECTTFYTLNSIGHIDFTCQDEWELAPDKFDLSTLKPYKSEVLHRNTLEGYWKPAFWGAYIPENSVEYGSYKFLTTYGFARYCIPYEGNEHLIGTTDDCSEYYKTWED